MDYIPEKLPKGTTREQWEQYAKDMEAHEARVEREKPQPPPLYFTHYRPTANYPTHAETAMEAARIYKLALSEWQMMSSCDAPNKPGYYRAAND
jgi:hypothetical protein